MRRLAIVEYIMSAGGVERVLRGLSDAFLEIPEARDWDITLLLSRYTSAGQRAQWPVHLKNSQLRVEWLGDDSALAKAIDPLAAGRGVLGFRSTRLPTQAAAHLLRSLGPRWWRRALGERAALIAEASKRFDLMYFTYPTWIDAPQLRIPIVTTPQDFNYRFFQSPGSWVFRRSERATRSWLSASRRILFSSDAVRHEMLRFWPEFAGKEAVVPLGVAQATAPTADAIEDLRARWDLRGRFVLMTGWVAPHKNQVALIKAMQRVRQSHPDVQIVFAGPNTAELAPGYGPARGYVQVVRSALDAGGFRYGRDFRALGYITDSDVQCLFRIASVFVLPSLYEGFGLPGLEAMLAGCPTVLSAIPPLLEQNERIGGIVPTFQPEDADTLARRVLSILEDEPCARETSRLAATRIATVYDWRKTARSYLQEFATLVDGG